MGANGDGPAEAPQGISGEIRRGPDLVHHVGDEAPIGRQDVEFRHHQADAPAFGELRRRRLQQLAPLARLAEQKQIARGRVQQAFVGEPGQFVAIGAGEAIVLARGTEDAEAMVWPGRRPAARKAAGERRILPVTPPIAKPAEDAPGLARLGGPGYACRLRNRALGNGPIRCIHGRPLTTSPREA